MRLLYNDYKDMLSIEEFTFINAVPAWNPENGTTQDNPDIYSVFIHRTGCEHGEYIGTYNINGSAEAYQAALENYKMIINKLLTKGYCKASDFKHFEWY